MSIYSRPFLTFAFAIFFPAAAAVSFAAQDLDASIEIDVSAGKAVIAGSFPGDVPGPRNVSFLGSAIGADGLGSRIANVAFEGANGRPAGHRRLNPVEFASDENIAAFRYSVGLDVLNDPRSAAHVSWVREGFGILLLDDLLPQSSASGGKRATVRLRVPEGWNILTTEPKSADGVYRIGDRRRAVFMIGNELREVRPPKAGEPTLVIHGKWPHTDIEAAEMAIEIFRAYSELFGGPPSMGSMIALFPFPQRGAALGTWEAETRGNAVLIASAGMPFRYQAMQRLHEQLRHEIFHLWIPNGVNLSGQYDWFYEGAAMYQSLKTAVSLKRIRFDDMLDTLSRAHRLDQSAPRRRSLIESARDRWAGAETQVYARGMLAAFMCDLSLLDTTGGKESLNRVLRVLFQNHKFPAATADGNTVILGLLDTQPGLRKVKESVIQGSGAVEWGPLITAAGLEFSSASDGGRLTVKASANGRQRSILRKLGYNGR